MSGWVKCSERMPPESGVCVDCGKHEGYTQEKDGSVCRDCYTDRANYSARSAWARAHVFDWIGEWHPYLDSYTVEQLAAWKADYLGRARKRAIVRANIDAYARGEFPGNESLMRGVYQEP